jgi:hypothetical protein
MTSSSTSKLQRTSEKMDWERHEAKYIIPVHIVPGIRSFIEPFCVPDPNGENGGCEYIVTTLQLDNRENSLLTAKEHESLNRFKLRVRTYGTEPGGHNIYLEIKRKIKHVVVKSRTTLPAAHWSRELLFGEGRLPPFRSEGEKNNFFEFIRICREIGAEPRLLIRYRRESYFGVNDRYARLTFDRQVSYRPTSAWDLWPVGGAWWSIDSETGLNRPFPGVILELKTYDQAPRWMMELVQAFDLVRVGFCKYQAAMRLESIFTGAQYSEASESTHWE